MSEQTAASKPVYKKWWFWVSVIVALSILSRLGGGESATPDPKLMIGDYMYQNEDVSGAVAYKFSTGQKVMFLSTALNFATSGKYTIDHTKRTIQFSDWDEALHPKGDCTFEASGDTITALVNNKGVRFTLEKH